MNSASRSTRIDSHIATIPSTLRDTRVQSIQSIRPSKADCRHSKRRGAATLDYILVLAVILSIAALLIPMSRHAISVVYEIICSLVAWPFV